MTSRNLSILGLVAVIAVVAGVWLAGRQAATPTDESTLLYPDLKQQLDAVTAVRIVKAGGTPAVELKRGENGWTVAERNNYPADDAKLRKLVTNLAEAQLVEEKTSNPESYAAIGVEDVSNATASGVQIDIDGLKQPVKLIVGKQASGAQSHYVRRAGEDKSWLINKSLDTSSSADQWLRKSIIDISADRIQSAEVTIGKAKPYTALKKSRADADFTVEGLPKGKELSSPSAADNFATALAGLTLSDVQPATTITEQSDARATIKTFDGLVVEATGWKKDDKHYIALQTSYDAATADKFKLATAETEKKDAAAAETEKQDTTAKAENKDAATEPDKKDAASNSDGAQPATEKAADESAKPATRNVAEEASKTNAQLTGWIYEIPAYKYDAIFKPVDELIKK